MDPKSLTQLVLLQLLGTVYLLFGRIPRFKLALDVLTDLVANHWDELWTIITGGTTGKMREAVDKLGSVQSLETEHDRILSEAGTRAATELKLIKGPATASVLPKA